MKVCNENKDVNCHIGVAFCIGDAAVQHITVDLSEYVITEEELNRISMGIDDYSVDNFVCFTVTYDSFMLDGEEQLDELKDISYFGFLLYDGAYLDIANMSTGTYYGLTKE